MPWIPAQNVKQSVPKSAYAPTQLGGTGFPKRSAGSSGAAALWEDSGTIQVTTSCSKNQVQCRPRKEITGSHLYSIRRVDIVFVCALCVRVSVTAWFVPPNPNSRNWSPSSGCGCEGKPYKPVCAGHSNKPGKQTYDNSCLAQCHGFSGWQRGKCNSGSSGSSHSSPGDSLLKLYSLKFHCIDWPPELCRVQSTSKVAATLCGGTYMYPLSTTLPWCSTCSRKHD